ARIDPIIQGAARIGSGLPKTHAEGAPIPATDVTKLPALLARTEASPLAPIKRRSGCRSRSKLVRGAETTPVAAIDADRHVDLAHHDGLAVAHVAGVALDQVGAQIAAGGEAGGIVEDAAVAAVGGVEGHVARALRMRVDLVVHGQIAVAVDH